MLKTEGTSSGFSAKAKLNIFTGFDIALKNRRLSISFAVFLIILNYSQMIAMSFNSYNVHVKNSLVSNFLFICDYLLIYYQLKVSPSPSFNIFITSVCTMFLLFLIMGFRYLINNKKNKDIFIAEFSNILALLFDSFDLAFVIPFVGTLALNLSCFDKSMCYSPVHIILIAWSIVLMVFVLALDIFYVFCFFNFTFKMNDALSRNPSSLSLAFLFIKVFIVFVSVFLDLKQDLNYNLLLIFHIINGSMKMYEVLFYFPYHHKNVAKIYGAFTATYLWVNISLFILNVVPVDLLKENSLIVLGLGLVFLVKLFLNLRNYLVKMLIISELDQIHSDIHLDLKLRFYNSLAKSLGIKKNELRLASLLKIHNDRCEDSNCICKKPNILYDPHKLKYGDSNIQFHRDEVFVKHYIIKMLKEGLSKFADSKLLYLDYFFYAFESLRLYGQLYFLIKYLEQKYQGNLSLSYEFCIFRLFAHLKRFLDKKNDKAGLTKNLKIENVKKFDKGILKLKLLIHQNLEHYQQIWSNLSENMPDLGDLLNKCNKCLQKNTEVVEQYNYLLSLNNQSAKLRNLMEIFCLHIAFDEMLMHRVEKEIHVLNHMELGDSLNQELHYLVTKYNIFDNNVGTISISMNLDSIGQITWISSNIPKIFLYESDQLKTMNISNLMPDIIGHSHIKLLENFYRTGKETAINNFRHLWGIDKFGFCFSLNILVKMVPYISHFETMGLIHKLNENDYILTNNKGEILSFGKKMSEVLEMTPEFVSNSKVNVQFLAPRLTQVFKNIFVEASEFEASSNYLISNQLKTTTPSRKNSSQNENSSKKNLKDPTHEYKIYMFLPNNLNEIFNFQEEIKNLTEKDPNTMTLKKKGADRLRDKSQSKDLKSQIHNLMRFGDVLKKKYKQLDWSSIKKVLRLKINIRTLRFFNGEIEFVALKVLFCEIKKPDILSFEKRQKQTKYINVFLKDMRKLEKHVNVLKESQNQKELEDKEELENKENDHNSEVSPKKKTGDKINMMLNLFRGGGGGGGGGGAGPGLVAASESPKNGVFNPFIKQSSKLPAPNVIGIFEKKLGGLGGLGGGNLLTSIQNNPERKESVFSAGINAGGEQALGGAGVPPPKANPFKKVFKSAMNKMKASSSHEGIEELLKKDKDPIETEEKEINNKQDDAANNTLFNKLRALKNAGPRNIDDSPNKSSETSANRSSSKKQTSNMPQISPSIAPFKLASTKMNFKPENAAVPTMPNNPIGGLPPATSPGTKKPSFLKQIEGLGKRKSGINFNVTKNPLLALEEKERDDPDRENSLEEKPKVKKNLWGGKLRDLLQSKGLIRPKDKKAPTKEELKKSSSKNSNGIGAGGMKDSANKLHNDNLSYKSNKSKGSNMTLKTEAVSSANSSNSSDEEKSDELMMFLRSEGKTSIQNQEEKADLIKIIAYNKQNEDDEHEQVVSVASSAFTTLAQNSLKMIKDSLKKQKVNRILKLSNYISFAISIIVTLIIIAQYVYTSNKLNQIKLEYEKINGITFYHENILEIFNAYYIFNAHAMNLSSDSDLFNQWKTNYKEKTQKMLKMFVRFTFDERMDEITSPLSKDYLFYDYEVIIKLQSQKIRKNVNFQEYCLLLVNSVNNTIGGNNFTNAAITENDYLSFVFDNFEVAKEILNANNKFLEYILSNSINSLLHDFLILWVFTFIIISMAISIVFPIVFKNKNRILNTLALFTKIPLHDVDFYNNHYKLVMLNLTSIDDSCDLLKAIKKQVELNRADLIQKKKNDSNMVTRSRKYKGINVDKVSYIVAAVFIVFLFSGLIIAKDYKLFTFLRFSENLDSIYLDQHKIISNIHLSLIRYKQMYMDYMLNGGKNYTFYEKDFIDNLNFEPGKLFTRAYEKFITLDYQYNDFFPNLIALRVCEILEKIRECKYFSNNYCNKSGLFSPQIATTFLLDEIWNNCDANTIYLEEETEGLLNLFLLIENKLRNQAKLFEEAMTRKYGTDVIKNYFESNNDWKFVNDLNRAAIIMRKWYYLCMNAFLNEVDIKLKENLNILIIFSVFSWLFVLFGWFTIYKKLCNDSKWVNGFIVIIPMHLIKENQHLKLFLKKKIKVGNIDK